MKRKDHYFDNAAVEKLLTRYVEGACTDRALRDEVMSHATPLIRGVIRKKQLQQLLQYHHKSNEDELIAVAWQQIEKTLYKYEPGRAKVFNLWTQIAFTVCMAYIKKETRDAVAVRKWREGEPHPKPLFEKRKRPDFYGIMEELREVVRPEYREMVDNLVEIYEKDAQPWVGIIGKLTQRGYTRRQARAFLAHVKTLSVAD